VKVGDLVKSIHGRIGVIIDIDPLRRYLHKPFTESMNEIVILLPCGTRWHAAPSRWEVLNENR